MLKVSISNPTNKQNIQNDYIKKMTEIGFGKSLNYPCSIALPIKSQRN